jgi:anti-anti-sigma factor
LEGFRLSAEYHGKVAIITLHGDLDMDTSRELDELLTRARREQSQIILDLAAVDFMDTSSLAVIVGHWKKLEAAGGVLALAGPRYRYTKALWITGLADRMPLFGSVEQAVAAAEAATSSSPAD